MSDVQSEPKYPRRSFGHIKNDALETLGASVGGDAIHAILMVSMVFLFLIFANFHAIYLKTGTPMFKYGFAMTFLQPFYTLWSLFVLLSKYLLP